MPKVTDLTPQFPIIPAEIEVVANNVQALSDFVGDQSVNTPVVVNQNHIESSNFSTGVSGWRIDSAGNVEFNAGTFRGTLTAGDLHIPDQDTTANSFHVDSAGNHWSGATETNKATAPFRVSNAGALVATTATITGGDLTSSELNSNVVEEANILDGAVATDKVAALAVTSAKIGALAVTTAKINTLAVTNAKINDLAVSKLTAGTIASQSIVMDVTPTAGDVEIRSGIATGDFNNSGSAAGFILGVDDSDSDKAKFYFGDGTDYIEWDGSTLTVEGTVGGTVSAADLSGTVGNSNLDAAAQGWQYDGAFSASDLNTVAWASGTFTTAAGTTYSISAGNTGNMSARTYIYLATGTSTTVFQTSTTASDAVGAGKVLVGVAQNSTSEATFQVFGGIGGLLVTGADIENSSITAGQITANTITATEIAATTITASEIAANTITASQIASGTITATEITAGTITGTEISATAIIVAGTGNNVAVLDGNDATYRIYAGDSTPADAPFRVTQSGDVFARKFNIAGQQIGVAVGENIQTAIDDLGADGGTVILSEGTHTVNYDITLGNDTLLKAATAGRSCVIDFATNSNSIIIAGTSTYTTGTISSISGGVTVTGSGTLWNTSSNVTTDHSLFINNRWYRIASVDSDTQITLSEPFLDAGTFVGTYRAAKTTENVEVDGVYIINSGQTALDIDDSNNVYITDCIFLGNNKAVEYTNVYISVSVNTSFNGSTSDGLSITDASGISVSNFICSVNGGHGILLNNVTNSPFSNFFSTSNTGDGVNGTDFSNSTMYAFSVSGNGGQGIELVSGCDNVSFANFNALGNTSDGVKLTATNDGAGFINGNFNSNGGYGLNIAASTCDNTRVVGNIFANNVSGTHVDSGTGTIIRANVGITDTVAAVAETFTAGEAISAEDAVAYGVYQSGGGIGFDTAQGGNWNASGSASGTKTNSLTVATNDDRLLVLFLSGDTAANFGTPTYNGVDCTAVEQEDPEAGELEMWVLPAPATGANDLDIPWTGSTGSVFGYRVFSFYNAHATQPDASVAVTNGGAYNFSTTITPLSPGAVVVGAFHCHGILSNQSAQTGLGNSGSNASGNGTSAFNMFTGYSDIVPFTDALTMSATWASDTDTAGVFMTIEPANAAVSAIVKADASTDATGLIYRSQSFFGFAESAISAGSTGAVIVSGRATLSSLVAGKQYFLSDTAGAIATTAGTNTRKVGIASSTTGLIVTNNW